MGESIPAVNPLTDPRAGSISLGEWLNLSSITPALANQLNLLVPTQEMEPFQRQIRTGLLQSAPTVGQVALFTATVPDDEAWRMIYLSIHQDDSVTHIYRWTVIPKIENGQLVMIARKSVNSNLETPLYRSFSEENSASRFAPRGPLPVEFMPGDQIDVFDLTSQTDATTIHKLSFRYELIPIPQKRSVDRLWTQQSL